MAELASKSMTAVTSVVSVVREETVIALRCNTRGTEQITLPLIAIPLMVVSIVLMAVGVGLPEWVEVDIRGPGDSDRGSITLGLYEGEYSFQRKLGSTSDDFDIDDELKEVPIERLYATSALAYSTILLLALTIVVTLYNSYHTVLRWWCGPGTIYVLSFFAGLFGVAGMGVFLDFYLWDLDGDELFQDATGFGHLLDEEGYYTATHVSYALGIYVAGAVLPFAVTAMAWRLVVLLPNQPERVMQASPSAFEMSVNVAPSSYPSEHDPVTVASREHATVLY